MAASGFTLVTAQVKDPLGQLYVNAVYSVTFVNLNGAAGGPVPKLGFSTFQTAIVGARCDSSGNLSVVLADNQLVAPAPSQWRFSICSHFYRNPDTRYCFEWQGFITGATLDITAQLQAVAALLPTGGGFVSGILTINNNNDPAQIITGTGIATVASNAGTTTINVPPQPAGIQTLNANSNPAQLITATGAATISQPAPGTTNINVNAITSINGDTTTAQQIIAGDGIVVTQISPGITVISLATIGGPPVLSAIAIAPNVVLGGELSTGTVTLTGPAPTAGAVITLLSSNPAAEVPLNVIIPEGGSLGTFTIITTPVTTSVVASISGTYGTTHNANLTVNAPVVVQRIYGGVGQPGATGVVTLAGTQVTLSTGDVLNELATTPEVVGQSWTFTPSGQSVYLLLYGASRTFVDGLTGFPYAFNPPLAAQVGGVTMYLYQSTNPLYGTTQPKVAS